MGYRFSRGDVEYLRSDEGRQALAACNELELSTSSWLSDIAAAREKVGDRYAAVVETVLLRRKARAKLDEPGEWLLTDDALQQASAHYVARYRADRLAGRDVHDVTCSIGADLVTLARTASRCVGSDLDEVRLAMARHNCAEAGVAPAVVLADALRPVSRGTAVVADPGRRDSSGRRTWRPEDFAPPLDALARTYAGRDLVVKCAPGVDPEVVPWAAEVEIISLDGQVREACLWSGGLAEVSRRATVLRSDGSREAVTDTEPDDAAVREVGEWIVDPDGAIVRAGLVRQYAARHGLGQLDHRIAYLTGEAPPAGVRAFRVLEHGKYSERALRAALRKRRVGRVEILVRGLDVDPNKLRPRLRLGGTEQASVVLTRIGPTPTALICRAERIPPS
ncbi:THUMP-like domain-containing protein [Haloechinothrix sp. LS1_15]|uniref:THUMP-like domain-containing protein n=1 Tax=Haloechinothrix sp. LS1_15 TaxID=2652248 RepID=UPI00294828DD|nr:class I SAM-dependent methyltransferase [Haloechinothrix sp. LS1_15]MDV6013536.1 class I SAM-dependent methyltransferase [Haloechinothrix sp. LS1_15]